MEFARLENDIAQVRDILREKNVSHASVEAESFSSSPSIGNTSDEIAEAEERAQRVLQEAEKK